MNKEEAQSILDDKCRTPGCWNFATYGYFRCHSCGTDRAFSDVEKTKYAEIEGYMMAVRALESM